jgi:NADH-quinone oxidoreductase subunit J
MIEFNGVTIAFFVFSFITLAGAYAVVTNKNLFRGTVWLMVSLFGGAGLFLTLSAPFLAAVQILVYIGAIAILFTFAVMLTRSLTNVKERYYRPIPVAAASVLLFVLIIVGVISPIWMSNPQTPVSDEVIRTVDFGLALVSGYGFVIPFEVASLLLTAAMIGAIVIARDSDEQA